MDIFLLFASIIILVCVFLNNASSRIGVPVLLAFILFGILFGHNGLVPVNFEDKDLAFQISTFALIGIMFYGGFGTRWQSARPVMVEAGLLATLGVVLTAALTGTFCHFVLRWGWVEALLMGSVVASTDAASVFSILRSRKLGLKNNTAPLLEVESGSNDPCSYMLTAIMLSIASGSANAGTIIWMTLAQLGFGALLGVVFGQAAVAVMRKMSFSTSGFQSLLMIATAIGAYAVPSLIGGNGFLSAYIAGMIIGNSKFENKKELVHFFDGLTGLMQVIIFFILGLLAEPASLWKSLLPALAIFLALSVISRPLSVAAILLPFRKYKFRQRMLVSFCGLRGASSIVFAIMAMASGLEFGHDIFSTVFCIVLISIGLQGTLIPVFARKMDMIDANDDVMKTFSDFADETDMQFFEIKVQQGNPWMGKKIMDIKLPKDILFCMILHADGSKAVPNGSTVILEGDRIITCSKAFHDDSLIHIVQQEIYEGSRMAGKCLKDYPFTAKEQVVLIRREDQTVIPHGDTVLQEGDVLYINRGLI